MDYKEEIGAYFKRVKEALDRTDKESLNVLANLLAGARDEGRQIFIMGNGGSAATASHYVCDFNKGASQGLGRKFKFICLNDNVPSLTAYGNDVGYEDVFVHSLSNYFRPGDLVIGVSGSGNSANVVKAVRYANERGGVTVGLTGFSGGRLAGICRYNVHVPVDDMQVAEDLHMVLGHCMMKVLSGGLG